MFSVLRNLVVLSAKIITTVSGTGQGVRNAPFYCATLAVYFVLYNNLSYARILIGFHLWSIRGQMYRWCHHLNLSFVYFNSLLYKTNGFQVACACSVIDHRGHQNMVRTSVTHSAAPCVPLFCSYHILMSSVIYYLTDAWQLGIYLLISKKVIFSQRNQQ